MSMMENYNYWNDSRVQASMTTSAYKVKEVNARSKTMIIEFADSLFEELEESGLLKENKLAVNLRYEVCPQCDGAGKVVNPNIDCGGISQEEFNCDPDFYDNYVSGAFDITCPECEDKRVVPEVKFSGDIKNVVDRWIEEEADYVRTCCAERAMGA